MADAYERAPGSKDRWSRLADWYLDRLERRFTLKGERHYTPRPVLLVCSSGGHLLQLAQLRDEWPRGQRVWVTFDTEDARSLLRGEDVRYAYHPTNRNIPNLIRNLALAARILATVRPRAVVSTGAGVAVPFCWLGRLFGCRVVFIESFARVWSPSLTGRLVHPVAHDFFVQWERLLGSYRKARYVGQIF